MAGLALFDVCIGIFIATQMPGDGFLSNGIAQFAVELIGVKALIAGLFPFFIWRGQGWSRIAYAVLTALSLAMSWYAIAHLVLVMPLLQLASLVLLFLPASEIWFARRAIKQPEGYLPLASVTQPEMLQAALPVPMPATLYGGVALMFVVLTLGLWCAGTMISAWMATWPQDDTALAYLLSFIPIGALIVGDVAVTVTLAVLLLNGFSAARFVYVGTTALFLRLLLGILSIAPARALILYAVCLVCFTLLFLPPSNRWLKARRA